MKKYILFLGLLFPLFCLAQEQDYISQIPVVDGKIIFTKTIPIPDNMDKLEVRNKLLASLNSYFENKRGLLRANDTINNQMVVQVIDFMEVEKRDVYEYFIWAKYTLAVNYSGADCVLEVRNIVFVDHDKEKEANPYAIKDLSSTAEYMFIEQKYRMALVKDAINKIAKCLVNDMDSLFTSVSSALK